MVVGQLIASATLLGIGFWLSKKVTGRLDEWLLMWELKRNNGMLPELTVIQGGTR